MGPSTQITFIFLLWLWISRGMLTKSPVIFGGQTSYCLIIISVDHCSFKWPSQALVRWPNFLIPILKRSPLNVLLRQYEGIKPGDLDPDWLVFRLSSMSLNKLLNFSLSQIPHLYNEDYDGAAVRINWVRAYKALEQCLVDSSHSAS